MIGFPADGLQDRSGPPMPPLQARPPAPVGRVPGWVKFLVGSLVVVLGGELVLRLAVAPEDLLDPRTEAYWIERAAAGSRTESVARDAARDPELGWTMAPGFEGEGVRHDERGRRRTVPSPEDPGAPRVLVIGDSFTYGLGVRDEETYASRLAALTGARVTNAGANAYGVDQACLTWERAATEAERWNVVVLGIYVDDVYRSGLAMREMPKPRFVPSQQPGEFVLRPVTPPSNDARGASALRLVDAAGWARRRIARKFGWLDEARLAELETLNTWLLRRLRDSVRGHGARLCVVFIGHEHDGQGDHSWIERSVERTCRDLDIPLVDLARARRDAAAAVNAGGSAPPESSWYGANGHFSPLGHEQAARAIAAELQLVR